MDHQRRVSTRFALALLGRTSVRPFSFINTSAFCPVCHAALGRRRSLVLARSVVLVSTRFCCGNAVAPFPKRHGSVRPHALQIQLSMNTFEPCAMILLLSTALRRSMSCSGYAGCNMCNRCGKFTELLAAQGKRLCPKCRIVVEPDATHCPDCGRILPPPFTPPGPPKM